MDISEELLAAWLRVTSVIRNDRIPEKLSYNESHVCNILYGNQLQKKRPLTATDLCDRTGLLKSQMNKVLTGLENKDMVIRHRCEDDKRKIIIELNQANIHIYEDEHKRVLGFVQDMVENIGMDDTKESIRILTRLSDAGEEIIRKRKL